MTPAHIKAYALAALIVISWVGGYRYGSFGTVPVQAVVADCSLRGAL